MSTRGRPASEQVAPGERGKTEKNTGIRRYVARDKKTVSYIARVSAFNPATGKVATAQKTFATKAEAEGWRDAQRNARNGGSFVFPDKGTVSDYLDVYLAAKATELKTTAHERNTERSRYLKAHLGHIRLQALTAQAIAAFNVTLEQKGLAPRTRLSILVLLKAALAHAVTAGKLKANPFAAVKMPKPDDGESTYALNSDDVESILRIFQNSTLRLPVLVLAFTGLRRGELYALRWTSLDFARNTLHVGGTVARTTKNGLTIESPKSEASRRTIAVDPAVMAELRALRQQQQDIARQLGLDFAQDWLVFPAAPDLPTTPKSPSGLCQGFKHKLRRSRYADVSPHDLRHAHGSLLLHAGESLPAVAARLGHSVLVCGSTYAHELRGREQAQVKLPLTVPKERALKLELVA